MSECACVYMQCTCLGVRLCFVGVGGFFGGRGSNECLFSVQLMCVFWGVSSTCLCFGVCICARARVHEKDLCTFSHFDIFIHSPALFLNLTFFPVLFFTAYCSNDFLFWVSVFFLSERPMNGRKIITITHIIEPSLLQVQLQ